MRSLRDLLAAALLALAALCGAAWLPAAWLADNVVDQQGFLAITEPLSADAALQRELSDAAVEATLPTDTLPSWLLEKVEPFAQDQAARITQSPSYDTVWSSTMTDLHSALFSPGADELDADVAPLVDDLVSGIDQYLPFGWTVPRPDSVPVHLASIPDIPWIGQARAVTEHVHWLPVAGVAFLLLAIAVAADRRVMLAVAGVFLALAGAGVWLGAANLGTLVPGSIDQAPFVGPIVQVFEQRMAADLTPQAVMMLGAGALLAVVGLGLAGLRRRSL